MKNYSSRKAIVSLGALMTLISIPLTVLVSPAALATLAAGLVIVYLGLTRTPTLEKAEKPTIEKQLTVATRSANLLRSRKLYAGIIIATLAFASGFGYAITFISQTLPSSNFVPNNPFQMCNTIAAYQVSANYVLYQCSTSFGQHNAAFVVTTATSAIPSYDLTGTGFDSLALTYDLFPNACNPSGANYAPLASGSPAALGPAHDYSYCAHYTSGSQFGALTIAWSG